MMGKGKISIVLSVAIYLILLFLLPACKDWNPTASNPEQPDVTYYTYEIKYERPAGSIIDNEWGDPGEVLLEVKTPWGKVQTPTPALKKLSDYSFIATSPKIAAKSSVKVWVCDPKRWKETTQQSNGQIWGNPHTVGDIFTLRCIETGFQKRLLKIEDYEEAIHDIGFPAGYEAKRASCKIQADGTITDE